MARPSQEDGSPVNDLTAFLNTFIAFSTRFLWIVYCLITSP